jgi:hypothetical protein
LKIEYCEGSFHDPGCWQGNALSPPPPEFLEEWAEREKEKINE